MKTSQNAKNGPKFSFLSASMIRILHNDWSIRLGENRRDQSSQPIKHLGVMLLMSSSVKSNVLSAYLGPRPLALARLLCF